MNDFRLKIGLFLAWNAHEVGKIVHGTIFFMQTFSFLGPKMCLFSFLLFECDCKWNIWHLARAQCETQSSSNEELPFYDVPVAFSCFVYARLRMQRKIVWKIPGDPFSLGFQVLVLLHSAFSLAAYEFSLSGSLNLIRDARWDQGWKKS